MITGLVAFLVVVLSLILAEPSPAWSDRSKTMRALLREWGGR